MGVWRGSLGCSATSNMFEFASTSSNGSCLPVSLPRASPCTASYFRHTQSLMTSFKVCRLPAKPMTCVRIQQTTECFHWSAKACVLRNPRILCSQEQPSHTGWNFHYFWKKKEKSLQWTTEHQRLKAQVKVCAVSYESRTFKNAGHTITQKHN